MTSRHVAFVPEGLCAQTDMTPKFDVAEP
jgi:hypothetical protein